MKVKKHYENSQEIIDRSTGEIVKSVRRYSRTVEKDRFMLVYLENMAGLLNIKSPIEFKVLFCLWEASEFDTNKVVIIKHLKIEISEKLGYAYKTVENAISRLSSKKLLVKTATSLYYLNPKYFFKGSEVARAKTLEVLLQFNLSNADDEEE